VIFVVHVNLLGRNVTVFEKNTVYRLMQVYEGGLLYLLVSYHQTRDKTVI